VARSRRSGGRGEGPPPSLPRGAREPRRISTEAELRGYLADILAGNYPFLWIYGRTGTGKTETFLEMAQGRRLLYCKGGRHSPLRLHIDAYHHRGELIALDDAEDFRNQDGGYRVMSNLGETRHVKLMDWGTTTHLLGDVPVRYRTTSPFLVLCNYAPQDPATLSRAVLVWFTPSNPEVHRMVGNWFWDQEIHDWFGRHLHEMGEVECRDYIAACNDKRAGRDWRRLLLASHGRPYEDALVLDLEHDPAYPTREDKARRFSQATGKVRATYFNTRRGMLAEGALGVEGVPPISLRNSRPPARPSQSEVDEADRRADRPRQGENREQPRPPDVPLRNDFQEPVRGQVNPNGQPPQPLQPRVRSDDTVGWERPPADDDDGEDDQD
jgi:hypothetical protein